MKAVVFDAHGEVDQLRYTDIPEPLYKPDEALIRVKAVSLNGFDPMILRGTTRLKTQFPMVPGGDFAGEIVALGSAVDRNCWHIGDRVCPNPHIKGQGMPGETLPGACRELIAMPAGNLLRMPDALSFVDAAALPIAYGTALRMVRTRGNIQANETVVILGATGGVGTCCVQLAVRAKAEVIACGSSGWKLQKLREIGASHAIDTSSQDMVAEVHRRFGRPSFHGGGGVDVVINYIGGDTWVPSLKMLKQNGRLLVCGATAGYDPPEDLRYIWSFEQNIIGCNGWTDDDLRDLMEMVVNGEIKPIVDSVRPLRETAAAMQDLIDRKIFGKVVILPDECADAPH